MVNKSGGALRTIIKESQGSRLSFADMADIKMMHFTGDHSKCTNCHSDKIKKFENEEAKQAYFLAWMEFADTFESYRLAETTNVIEGINSSRRKFTDKRLNMGSSYKTRSNMSLLNKFVNNWIELVMEKMDVPVTYAMRLHLKVSFFFFLFSIVDSN